MKYSLRSLFAVIAGIAVLCSLLIWLLVGIYQRNHAIQIAKAHGAVPFEDHGKVYSIALNGRRNVDEVLGELSKIPELNELFITNVPLKENDLQLIAQLHGLRALYLSNCSLHDSELPCLRAMTQLTKLDLTQNPITDDGLQWLSRLTHLELLALQGTNVAGYGLKHIASDLRQLRLNNTQIDDQSLEECLRFHDLQSLWLTDTQVTERGLMKLVSLHSLQSVAWPSSISSGARQEFIDAQERAARHARFGAVLAPP